MEYRGVGELPALLRLLVLLGVVAGLVYLPRWVGGLVCLPRWLAAET